MNKFYSVSEASKKLGISERQIRNWIHKGRLEAEKVKGIWQIYSDFSKFSGNGNGNQTEEKEEAFPVSDEPSDEVIWLRERVENLESQVIELQQQLGETKERSDTIILQLTSRLESKQKQLEDFRERSLWRRFKVALGFG